MQLQNNSIKVQRIWLIFNSSCPLPLTDVWPLPVTALQYEIELIVVLFNMASLNKSINALGSCVSPLFRLGWTGVQPGSVVKCRLGWLTDLPLYYTVMNRVVNCHLSFTFITLSGITAMGAYLSEWWPHYQRPGIFGRQWCYHWLITDVFHLALQRNLEH